MSADFIDLNVLVKNAVVCVRLNRTDKVIGMFDILVNVVSNEALGDIEFLLEHVTKGTYKFHKLEQLILPEYDDATGLASEATVDQCKDAPKRVMQANYNINRYFSSDPDGDGIHVVMQLPAVIKLNVLVQNALVSIDINNERNAKDIYEVLSEQDPIKVGELLQHVTKSSCKLHKLEQSILPEHDDNSGVALEATVNKCKATPKQLMQATDKIKKFFQSNPEAQEHVHVVMQLPDKIYRKIKFNVLVHDALVAIDMSNKRDVKDIFEIVFKTAPKKPLLGQVRKEDCELHKLEQPILIKRDVKSKGLNNATIEQCRTTNAEVMELNQEVYDYFDSNPDVGRIHVVMQLPDKIYGKARLNVLIYNALIAIDIDNEGLVKDIYEEVKVLLPEDVKGKISDLQTSTLIFEKLDPPVEYQLGGDDAHVSDETAKECQEADKKRMMNRVQIVNYFTCDSLSEFHIHAIIRPPEDAIESAINNMKRLDPDLYKRLQVRRKNRNAWSREDYPPFAEINNVSAHMEFEEELKAPRTFYLESGNRFFKLALSVLGKSMFSNILFGNVQNLPNDFMPDKPAAVSDSSATVSAEELELLIFSTLEPAFVKRIERFKGDNATSHFKQALFLWHFILHPALAVEGEGYLKFTTENHSLIKYYVMCQKDNGEWTILGSYKPYSDMAIISSKLGCPFLLCKVDSHQHKKDKHRMLAVATSAARVGQYLLKGTSDIFVLMAIFVTKDVVVERYLISQTKVDDTEVVITEQTFDLAKPEEAYEFLRQMYNFARHVNEMAKKLDETKEGLLKKMNEAGKDIRSYESNKKSETRDTGNVDNDPPLPSIPENRNEETDALEEVWERSDVRELFEDIGCNTRDWFEMIGHPGVISIEKEGKGLVYMKYISYGNIRELEILQYLKKRDPSWTYILPFQHWNIDGGTIVEFPRGGVHITDYLKSGSNPIPIALQLIEAVKFLHKHNVAHRDIKSENILVNSSGKLWLIDYSLARQVSGEDEMRKGFVGTPGRVAPEIKDDGGAHSPMRADRWAVGYVIKTICQICGPSPQQRFLERLSGSLMVYDPLARLSMQRCSEDITQELNKQQALNVRASSKFMNGRNNQSLVVAS